MQRFRISRRALLAGAGGVGVALPLLDIMGDGAKAQDRLTPRRYVLVFAGQAIGGDQWPNDYWMVDGVRAGTDERHYGHYIVPRSLGAGFEMTTPLEPLADLREHWSIVSNLRIPYSTTSAEASEVPPGGAYRDFHGGGKSPLLSGTRSTAASFTCNGPTSDQVIARGSAGATLHDSLVYRAQPSWYLSGSSYAGRQYVSYAGMGDPIEAQTSPRVAFDALFRGFMPGDRAATARADFDRRTRRSVLDVIMSRRDRLLSRVGVLDRERLTRHFDQLRDLESRIDALPPAAVGECRVPTDPGADPAVGGDNSGSGSDDIRPGSGYSNETERAAIFAELIRMAFTCDLTRVATLQITTFQSHMSVLPFTSAMGTPIYADLHEVGHNGDANNRGQLAVSTCLKWHVQTYAALVRSLAETTEGSSRLIDNTVAVFTPEAGHGTQLNDAVTEYQTHSVERMVMLLAGAGERLKLGEHVNGMGGHPAQCLLAAMQAAGHQGETLGEVRGALSEVLR